MNSKPYDVAIIGGGIVGIATAMALTERRSLSLIVLEAESDLAAHQTGHNSGVIHSGLYYKPGSLKARNCVEGREAMYRFCEKFSLPHERCGKVVVATRYAELPALEMLEERGRANGLKGLRRLDREGINRFEPHASGIAGLYVPETGIVDYPAVTRKMAEVAQERGAEICTSARVRGFRSRPGEYVLSTDRGEVICKTLINCAGLQSDRIARMCGVRPGLQIVPFRGEYYELNPRREFLVKNLIYPVPDTRFPFLGVHFTRMVHGGVEIGPNAVLAFRREGYKLLQIHPRDMVQYGLYPGFWRMALKYWRMGTGEFYRSLSKPAFVRAMQRLIPAVRAEDVHRSGAGVRAQALEPNGQLVDDFRIIQSERMVHVLNAPSPAATASISIGRTIADMAMQIL
ncbi:MAG TPA: L-2-hydroxyglutarate oxidase [Chloroflexi bacterium]|nr:L-2-hydroxyglutarate oxidase [Chloroflexota bacterium]